MYRTKVNNRFEFTTKTEKDRIFLDDGANWDVVSLGEGRFHVLVNNKSYEAELLSADPAEKTAMIRVNGNNYEVKLQDKYDLLLQQLGMGSAGAQKLNNLKAPMPGLVIEVKVNVGETVKKGDAILILEAMKMENVLKSSGDGIVKRVCVIKKDAVEKGQVLVEFE